jgi:hypothetical protein
MENAKIFEYGVRIKHIFKTVIFLILASLVILWMWNSGSEAEAFKTTLLAICVTIYVFVAFVRIDLSEKAVSISESAISVPLANRAALPILTQVYKNVRIPFESVVGILPLKSGKHEYLHIYFDDESTTLVSSMFVDKYEFDKFKSQLYERLDIDEDE